MPIEVICRCGRKANVPDSLAGKRGKCRACGEPLEVPASPSIESAPPVEGSSTSDTIELQCGACSRKFRVSDVAAGKQWRCRCGEMVDVPAKPGRPSSGARPVVDESMEEMAVIGSSDEIRAEVSPILGPKKPRMLAFPVDDPSLQRVVVVNFDMKFTTMILFMIKVAVASIPAVMILWAIGIFITFLVLSFLTLVGLIGGSAANSRASGGPAFDRPVVERPAEIDTLPFMNRAEPARKKR